MSLPRALFEAIKIRDGFECLLQLHGCEGEGNVLDHRANRQSGGSIVLNHPANLILACWRCNGAKADARGLVLLDLEERGLYVLPHATHAKTLARALETPVEYPNGRRFYLVSATEKEPVEDVMRSTP